MKLELISQQERLVTMNSIMKTSSDSSEIDLAKDSAQLARMAITELEERLLYLQDVFEEKIDTPVNKIFPHTDNLLL